MSFIKKEKQRKFELEDLNANDIEMLSLAAHVPPKTWFCFGLSFYKLYDLGLVDNDNAVTFYGKQLIKSLQM